MTGFQLQVVHNALFIAHRARWLLIVSGLDILIAAHHYVRIFNSGVDAYDYSTGFAKLTGVPFKDVYRYIEWLLIVLLLLTEFFLAMKLNDDEFNSKS